MNYLSIQTLAAVFQESISLLPLLMVVWHELKINEKLRAMCVNKHHGTPFHENVHHMTYLPFINAKSANQLADNLPYHQRVFTYLFSSQLSGLFMETSAILASGICAPSIDIYGSSPNTTPSTIPEIIPEAFTALPLASIADMLYTY